MNLQSIMTRVCFAAALSAVAGCFSLGRDAPPVQHYVLSATRTVDAPASPDATGVTLGMRRLDLASYLASPFIIVRRGTHQITTSEYHRWGEELGHGASRAVASHLSAAAPIGTVSIAPWPVRTSHDYLLQLHVSRFEGVADSVMAASAGSAHVAASWEIVRPVDGVVLARGITDHHRQGWRVGDYGALVTMLEEGLNTIAGDVASCVLRLAAAPPVETAAVQELPLDCGQQ